MSENNSWNPTTHHRPMMLATILSLATAFVTMALTGAPRSEMRIAPRIVPVEAVSGWVSGNTIVVNSGAPMTTCWSGNRFGAVVSMPPLFVEEVSGP